MRAKQAMVFHAQALQKALRQTHGGLHPGKANDCMEDYCFHSRSFYRAQDEYNQMLIERSK